MWTPVQAREEQEKPQTQKRGKYDHNELYVVENTALARSAHDMIDWEGRRPKSRGLRKETVAPGPLMADCCAAAFEAAVWWGCVAARMWGRGERECVD